jgi:hypothetical protein
VIETEVFRIHWLGGMKGRARDDEDDMLPICQTGMKIG